ncbi:MAG TPA: aminodeoxychorismate synthase component I [Acidobacteriaceae bacterium]|nr:aminodeoxychorismate synthase component I [Acidobacteriaceae bacterium]
MPKPPQARYTPLPTSIHTLVESTPNAILLETSRFDATNHHSYLFLNPTRILTAHTLDEIPALFAQIEAALAEGLYLAGYFSYECNAHFEPTTARPPIQPSPSAHDPLAHLAAYPAPIIFDHATATFLHPPPSRVPQVSLLRPGFPPPSEPTPHPSPILTNPTLRISDGDYLAAIEKIKNYISAGDTYQVNFTDAIRFPTDLSPATLFTALSQTQSVAYAAFLNLDHHQILSLSPELFFRIEADPDGTTNKITTRPMKGTMPRGLDITEDAAAARALQHDEKNRAEHVMIVDLLRNDLGRISLPGSVHVDDLFSIERYQTLHQMTSTISATLRPRTTFYDIFAAMFPCGSVTGAPKIRTMQIIRELEAHPRGVYTGAIGFIAPNRSAVFNVAIRTLVLQKGIAHMGVGGGIVADSIPADEHREALLKANFLTRTHQSFELIETLLYDQHYARLPLHLDRLESSALYFDFLCDRTAIEAQLRAFAHFLDPRHPHRVRLLLSSTGEASITAQPLQPTQDPNPESSCLSFCHSPRESAVVSPRRESIDPATAPAPDPPTTTVTLSPHRTNSADLFLRHKTTHRNLYNEELTRARAEGFDEVIFLNERNELTEGAISNLFVKKPAGPAGEGKLLTPPLASGVLPGVMRRHLLETLPHAQEQILTLADLEPPNTLWLCSSVRGLRKANLRAKP